MNKHLKETCQSQTDSEAAAEKYLHRCLSSISGRNKLTLTLKTPQTESKCKGETVKYSVPLDCLSHTNKKSVSFVKEKTKRH